jgi:hypothetical protein
VVFWVVVGGVVVALVAEEEEEEEEELGIMIDTMVGRVRATNARAGGGLLSARPYWWSVMG